MTIAAYARLVRAAAVERRASGHRARVPEPMEMNNPASVASFHAGADDPQAPVYGFNAEMISRLLPEGGTLVDLGSGSGRLVARLAESRPDVRIIGTELAENMLATGRAELAALGLAGRVELRRIDITSIPAEIAPEIDAVSCVWALHEGGRDALPGGDGHAASAPSLRGLDLRFRPAARARDDASPARAVPRCRSRPP
jgi:SAM-dependent methyltransferase